MYEYTQTPNRLGSPEKSAAGVLCRGLYLTILIIARTIIIIKAVEKNEKMLISYDFTKAESQLKEQGLG